MTPPVNTEDGFVSAARCPDCGAMQATQMSLFGMFLFTARYQCGACGGEFERIKVHSDLETADSRCEGSSQ
jgi:DNA-directed RNA polymerase subunit RPC12/RpoP